MGERQEDDWRRAGQFSVVADEVLNLDDACDCDCDVRERPKRRERRGIVMLLMITEEVGDVAFRIQTMFWPAWVLLVCWPCTRSPATGHIGFDACIAVSATSNHFHTSHYDSILNVYRKRMQVIHSVLHKAHGTETAVAREVSWTRQLGSRWSWATITYTH